MKEGEKEGEEPIPSGDTTDPTHSDDKDNGLGTTELALIIVFSIIGGGLIIFGIVFFLLRRKRKKNLTVQVDSGAIDLIQFS